MEEEKNLLENFLRFLDDSPTAFHAVRNAERLLQEAGFQKLQEKDPWQLQRGGCYYVTRNSSSLTAFRMPEEGWDGFHMMAAHTDSPCFKIKEKPEMEVEKKYVKLNVEKYGGLIPSTWLDRPLSAAGRLVVQEGEELCEKLVDLKGLTLVIPNLAVHMNRELNSGCAYQIQKDLLPLFAGAAEGSRLLELAAAEAGVEPSAVLGSDLYLYSKERAVQMGAAGEFIGAPRLDDLQCVYGALNGLLRAQSCKKHMPLLALFDNEEVGSGTKQGAASTFLRDVLERVCRIEGKTGEDFYRLLAGSFVVSCDNAHAVHPNHPEKADPTNRPYLNGGIVLKFNGSQHYATDAPSAAVLVRLCREAGVPLQTYVNHSDVPGGSTLGNISAERVSVDTVDIGLPQLAMHSAFETAGAEDLFSLIRLAEAFYGE